MIKTVCFLAGSISFVDDVEAEVLQRWLEQSGRGA